MRQRDRDKVTEDGGRDWTDASTSWATPKKTTRSWQRDLEWIFPWSLQKKPALLTPPFKTFGSQTCWFKAPVYDHLLWQPPETQILGVPRMWDSTILSPGQPQSCVCSRKFSERQWLPLECSLHSVFLSCDSALCVNGTRLSHIPLQWEVMAGDARMMGVPWSLTQ